MSRLARHSLVYLSSNVLTAALPLLLLPVLTRFLTPAEYGQVATFQTLAGIGLLIVSLNLHGAVSVRRYKNQADLSTYVATCVVISGVISALSMAVLVPFHQVVGDSLGIPGPWLFYAVIYGFAGGLMWHRLVLWQTSDRPMPYGIFNFGLSAANLGLSLWLVVMLEMGANGRVFALVTSMIGFGLLAAILIRRERLLDLQWDSSAASNALRFGLPLLPHSLAGIAMSQADRFLIGQRLGFEEAGVYAVAMQLTLPIVIVAESFNRAYVPWLYRQLSEGNSSIALAVSAVGVVASMLGTVLFVACAIMLVPILLGPEFAAASGLMIWLAPAMAAQAAYFMFVNFIYYSERNRALPIISLSGALAFVGIGYFAVSYGPFGLAVTYSLIWICQTTAIFLVARKVHPLPWFSSAAYVRGFALVRQALRT